MQLLDDLLLYFQSKQNLDRCGIDNLYRNICSRKLTSASESEEKIYMATIYDVAKYITRAYGEMSAMKLQKLMYYSQAWNLVWQESALFDEDFEAWANGPVLPSLYACHRGMFSVTSDLFSTGNIENIDHVQRMNIDKVLGFYGTQTAQWLSNLTHQEMPWLQARDGLAPGTISNQPIPKSAMHEYYSGL